VSPDSFHCKLGRSFGPSSGINNQRVSGFRRWLINAAPGNGETVLASSILLAIIHFIK